MKCFKKKSIRTAIIFSTATLLILTVSGCRGRTSIEERDSRAMPDNAHYMSEEEIGRTIIKVAASRKWACSHNAPTNLKCQLQTRGHQASINIKYSQEEYSITHLGSKNMKETNNRIHPKYNKWIQNLEQNIFQAISKK